MTIYDSSRGELSVCCGGTVPRYRHVISSRGYSRDTDVTRNEDCSWLVDISDTEEDIFTPFSCHSRQCGVDLLKIIGVIMHWGWIRVIRWRTNIMLMCIVGLALYLVLFDPSIGQIPEGAIDLAEIEQELEIGNPVRLVTYKSPVDEKIYAIPVSNKSKYSRDYMFEANLARTLKFHNIWTWADNAISHKELFPEEPEVDEVITALQTAKIVNVDVLDHGKYESGTSEKWVVSLEGGQKAMLKIVWEDKGEMKIDALCNYGYEIPTSEIAAFHLHRALGFRNTPYVTGRVVDLKMEVLPVASPRVLKQISQSHGNQTCVVGKCYFCKSEQKMCPHDSLVEVSLGYWIPRKLDLYTRPPKYMPYSTPSMEEWGLIGFNNKTYCEKVRGISPYEQDNYYYDLFDFAVLDTLMYHFDSKHYIINDLSDAKGSTIRLDHGRAFCAHDRDDLHIFMAPLTQCCTLRKSSWDKLNSNRATWIRTLRQRLERDPIAPVLVQKWYPVLERRMDAILNIMELCAKANGGWDKVLVNG